MYSHSARFNNNHAGLKQKKPTYMKKKKKKKKKDIILGFFVYSDNDQGWSKKQKEKNKMQKYDKQNMIMKSRARDRRYKYQI